MATQKKAVEVKQTIENFWWLQRTDNPDESKNPSITAISNIYCLADFFGMDLSEVEEKCGAKPGYFKKFLDDTEKTWNDDTTPISKQTHPEISHEIVEKASKLFYITEETLYNTALSPNFYYYTFGKPTSLNVKEANDENMKLVLFIEKINLDCQNFIFNIASCVGGDPNHFGAKYELEPADKENGLDYRFKVHKDSNDGSIGIVVGNVVNGTLVFYKGDLVYPLAERMENVLYAAAERDAHCKKVTQIPTNVLGIMGDFLDNKKREKIEPVFIKPVEKKEEIKEIIPEEKPEEYYLDEGDTEEEKKEDEQPEECKKCEHRSVG